MIHLFKRAMKDCVAESGAAEVGSVCMGCVHAGGVDYGSEHIYKCDLNLDNVDPDLRACASFIKRNGQIKHTLEHIDLIDLDHYTPVS